MHSVSNYTLSDPKQWLKSRGTDEMLWHIKGNGHIKIIDKVIPFLDACSVGKMALVCKAWAWELLKVEVSLQVDKPIPVQELPPDIQESIISFISGSTKLTKKIGRATPQSFTPPHFLDRLNSAHQLTEELYFIYQVSLLSKECHAALAEQRKQLSTRIVELITEIQDAQGRDRGAQCLRDCIDTGCYLKALRVFFFYKPQALMNYATDPARHDGYERTILHSAVSPNAWYISVPFVSFILEMDQKHHLDLMFHRESNGSTPLKKTDLFGQLIYIRDKPVFIGWKKAYLLLLDYSKRIAQQNPSLPQ